MSSKEGFTLVCPIRGRLSISGRSRDGLSALEERYRVEALQHLVDAGYPKENFKVEPVVQRLGNNGRNSVRADFAILDQPAEAHMSVEDILNHAVVLGEVKRDHKDAEKATFYQVKPLLAFANNRDCVAVLWDDVEQLVFWNTFEGSTKVTKQGPIELLPAYGQKPGTRRLELSDLREDPPLREIFKRVEDILHAQGISEAKRFQILLQLLLSKIFDELSAVNQQGTSPRFQDFKALQYTLRASDKQYRDLVRDAVSYYQTHLPEQLPVTPLINGEVLTDISSLLAPYRVTSASHSVIQDFYMYFARGMYRWDLAQYFTPPSVTNFIVDVIAPKWNESVLDPACGSADFLTSAYRRGVERGFSGYADKMHGFDSSAESVQVAVLNMVLNGDGKSNIQHRDSLLVDKNEQNSWDVVICNPPFGKQIQERKESTLERFHIGHKHSEGTQTPDVLPAQEVGLLFCELVVKLAKEKSGRIALVVPNGYLGNTSEKYRSIREWLFKHVRIAAIIALPRFTFKSSGADVSASVLFVEKLSTPLKEVPKNDSYHVAVHVVNHVGWRTGDKKAPVLYHRDPDNGNLVLDEEQQPIIEVDFPAILTDLRASAAAQDFPWLAAGPNTDFETQGEGYSIPVDNILTDPQLTLDAKRHCRKIAKIREEILSIDHFILGDVVEVIGERTTSRGDKISIKPSRLYRYVELSDVESGTFRFNTMRGWELPARARHFSEPGDFYIGAVWGSVRKWMVSGDNLPGLVVTNGMIRFRVKDEFKHLTTDIAAGLTSEAFAAQMRALARGSDGLAEIRPEELSRVVLPVIPEGNARAEIEVFVNRMLKGITSIESAVQALGSSGELPTAPVASRSSHTHLV